MQSITQKLMEKFIKEVGEDYIVKSISNTLDYADSYTHRCCVDPVGMGIMKDNGDGTSSFVRPKEFVSES